MMEYKGYHGQVQYEDRDETFHGRIVVAMAEKSRHQHHFPDRYRNEVHKASF